MSSLDSNFEEILRNLGFGRENPYQTCGFNPSNNMTNFTSNVTFNSSIKKRDTRNTELDIVNTGSAELDKIKSEFINLFKAHVLKPAPNETSKSKSKVLEGIFSFLHKNVPFNSSCYVQKFTNQSLQPKMTIVDEWNLRDERKYLVPLASSIFMLGGIVGSFVFALMSDIHGRKRAFLCSILLYSVSSVLPAIWSPHYIVFSIYRFFQGMSHSGNFMCHMVLLSELLPKEKKFLFTFVSTIFFTLGHILLAIMAYYLPNWKNLQLATGIISAFYVLLLYFIDESVYWLVAKGKMKRASKLIIKAARFNGKLKNSGTMFKFNNIVTSLREEYHHITPTNNTQTFDKSKDGLLKNDNKTESDLATLSVPLVKPENIEEMENIIEVKEKTTMDKLKLRWPLMRKNILTPKTKDIDKNLDMTEHLRFRDIFVKPILRARTFMAALSTFFLYQLHMALIFGSHLLPGNQYINFSLTGLTEIPINLIGLYALKIGRRKPLILFNTLTALALLIRWLIPTLSGRPINNALNIALYMIGRSFNGGALVITFLYIAEIYPTEIRNSGYGFNNAVSRAGYMISPFISYLEKYHTAYFPLLMVVFCFLSSLFTAFLPPTKNKAMAKNLSDLTKNN
ncbi:solute carrier family 22 member 15-like isoform X2 [Gordionus sp. m RMFG-2023]|uniref:solute carrier family 22 member 15-like isoform X2 n=1 Tax=Gordionus sp. m RMFG-2023 TaxID=3053472 RepID=UPI0031FC9765